MKLNELLQKYVNMSDDELMVIAQQAMTAIFPYCKAVDKEYDGAFVLTSILVACVSADGKVNEAEAKFISNLTGVSLDKVRDLVTNAPYQRIYELTDVFADALDVDAKAAMAALVTTVMASDHRVTVEENKFLRRILE